MKQIVKSLAGVTITVQPVEINRSQDLTDYQYTLEGPDFNYTAQDLEEESIQHAQATLLNRLSECWEGFPRSVNRWAMRNHAEIYWQARAMEDYIDRCDYIRATEESK